MGISLCRCIVEKMMLWQALSSDALAVASVLYFLFELNAKFAVYSWRSISFVLVHSCVHTPTCCTHVVLLHNLSAHIRTSSCVCAYTYGSVSERVRIHAWLSVWKNLLHGVCRESHLCFMCHPFLLSFSRRLSLSIFTSTRCWPNFLVLKSAGNVYISQECFGV